MSFSLATFLWTSRVFQTEGHVFEMCLSEDATVHGVASLTPLPLL